MPLDLDNESEKLPATSETPETILLGQFDAQAVSDALDQLPVMHREMILLCDVEEMSYQEISQTVGIPIGTVMSRLSRARQALRNTLRHLRKE